MKGPEIELNTEHSCDRIVAGASAGELVGELVGEWGVSVGFRLDVKSSGAVTFTNFQFDEVVAYAAGRMLESDGALSFRDLYIEDPWTKVSGRVSRIECQVFTVGKQSQIMVNFDFEDEAKYYGIERYLNRVEPSRCLRFDYKDRRIVECEAYQPRI